MSTRFRRQLIAVSIFLLFALCVATMFRRAVVQGDSMLPTYQNGQTLLVNRLYRLSGPLKRGDVVLFKRGNDILIKRVAYLPGENIPGSRALRFRRVAEYFERPQIASRPGADSFTERWTLKVPDGFVVVLGDNPSVSEDSRIFGPIPLGDIIGRVINAQPKL